MYAKVARLWRTVRHLRAVQVYGRVLFRLSRPLTNRSPAPALRIGAREFVQPAARDASVTGSDSFIFLSDAGSLTTDGWDNPARPKLWRYNQHYFDDLNAQDADSRTVWHHGLIDRWIADNPPGVGTGWEPYPTSLRIVNWVKWALRGNRLDDAALNSLAVQVRWLTRRLEWHLLGNHLFINAKALVFAGLYFKGDEAEGWLSKGLQIFECQIPEQILEDGGQFELSPMYHALAVEDMLDLVNIARTYQQENLTAACVPQVSQMLDWLETLCHPDGGLSFFNDTAFGIAPSTNELFDYARRLEFPCPVKTGSLRYLEASGYARLTAGPTVVIADLARIGPDYLPGHAHADTLSYEMSLSGQRIVVNSGTSLYGLCPERLRQRGTAAHSTLTVDGRDSSEVWSGFRVGRRAKPFDIEFEETEFALMATAAHDGFCYLPGAPVHRRFWNLDREQLVVIDRIEGQGHHNVEAYLHLAPGIGLRESTSDYWILENKLGQQIAKLFTDGGRTEIISSSWHPRFGTSIPTLCLKLIADVELPHLLRVQIHWTTQ